MSLSIAQLYRQDENKYKLDLLAGRQGLSRDVAWVQVMEDADYGTFLRPHAFIFTTGLASHGDPHWLERLLMPCWQLMRPAWSSIRESTSCRRILRKP